VSAGSFAFVLATTRWWSWEAAIRQGLDTDVRSYQQIARAAPALPPRDLPEQHAERFPIHWLVGVVSSDATLHATYYALTLGVLAAIVLLFQAHVLRSGITTAACAPASVVLIASPYLFRLDALGPGLVVDAVFALGLAGVVAGLAARRDAATLVALGVAAAARQTALPVGLVAAVIILERSRRPARAVAFAVVPLVIYLVQHAVAARFSIPVASRWEITVFAEPGSPQLLAKHVLLVMLPLLPALGLLLGGVVGRGVPSDIVVPVALAAAVVVQPLVLSPGWVNQNEQRLASLSLPALAAAAAVVLQRVDITARTSTMLAALAFVASFHHLTAIGPQTRAVYVTVAVAASAAMAATVARAARSRKLS